MSRLLYFLFSLAIVPAIGMEMAHNYKATPYPTAESCELNFIDLEQELIKITDEREPKQLLHGQELDQDSFAQTRGELLDMIDEDTCQQESIDYADIYCPPLSAKPVDTRSVEKRAYQLLSEKPVVEQRNLIKETAQSFFETYPQRIAHEDNFRKILDATRSMSDLKSIKKILTAFQKWYPRSCEWISDLHELALTDLTLKFGYVKKFKKMALGYNTPGALTWLSKQKNACQTIPVEKLNDLVMDARMAFHNCEEPKTVALIAVLKKTPFNKCARKALFQAVERNVLTLATLKNQQEMEINIITRINILGQAQYNFEKPDGQAIMHIALKSGFPRIVAALENYGMVNPTRLLLPFYNGEKTINEKATILEKLYAKKDTEPEQDFTWQPCDALPKGKLRKILP